MMRVTDMVHLCLAPVLAPGDWVIDATVGNGHDTAFLADRVGPDGRVFGFDVQAAAVTSAAHRLGTRRQVELIRAGHETMAQHLPAEATGRIAAVMFNLGYLPGGDKTLTTRAPSTLAALAAGLGLMKVGGRLSVVVYPGHPGGGAEADAVRAFVRGLPTAFAAFHAVRINAAAGAPEVMIVERIG